VLGVNYTNLHAINGKQ